MCPTYSHTKTDRDHATLQAATGRIYAIHAMWPDNSADNEERD